MNYGVANVSLMETEILSLLERWNLSASRRMSFQSGEKFKQRQSATRRAIVELKMGAVSRVSSRFELLCPCKVSFVHSFFLTSNKTLILCQRLQVNSCGCKGYDIENRLRDRQEGRRG